MSRLRWGRDNEETRHAYVIAWLQSLPKGSRILDAGAGTQRYRQHASHLQYVSQDFGGYVGGEEFAGRAAGAWDSTTCDILSDIVAIPVPDESFDFVLCTEVFEHLQEPERALGELTRVVRTNGEMLVTAPFRCLYHQMPHFYYSGFSTYWYRACAEKLKLDVVELTPNGTYYTDLAQEVFRIASLPRSVPGRLLTWAATVPYAAFLYCLEHVFRVPAPESCWGYHCRLRKR